MEINTISASALEELYKQGNSINLIDVRTPVEFSEAHLEFARNVPLDKLGPESALTKSAGTRSEPIYLICRGGTRGREGALRLKNSGFSDVTNVEGGMLACEKTQLPILRGAKCVSLERQVRIAAGSLVLLGVLGAVFIYPPLIWISGFVGAGLVFAGVTDTCAMGSMLAKMPWNTRNESESPGPSCCLK